jgi:hypothetical protein
MLWTDPGPTGLRDETMSDEQLSRYLEGLREIAAMVRKPEHRRSQGPGLADCPACDFGTSFETGRACRYCGGKEVVPCPDCTGTPGLRTCVACDGEGRVRRACEECAGTRTVPDPRAAADVATCLWCAGTARRACADCDEEGDVEAACRWCQGGGEEACGKCLGRSQVLCPKCHGAGKLPPEKKGRRAKTCKACKQTGRQRCYDCEQSGLQPCRPCDGDGRITRTCPACLGDRVTPCMGCFRGRYRQWEASAELLDSMGEAKAALRFWEAAAARVEPCYRRRIDLRLDDRTPAELERELAAERARLERAVGIARERAARE